ncbi:hypothetical protein A2U94_16160 [Bacillus sp. VT 712]|uniref:Uncharacterized protein n=4 Tax=Priestia TaxID=2800373 RepID=A0A0V8JH70_9BACI|nr:MULTISPECIES: hypothetical protein [Bacillaceae]KSU86351.1 hypothetical protein AS180_19065 [Priestia veravalensis]KZB90441.1 hypothetical protein A2U94_16160 [Bacillus sp. VT 712]MBY6085742.1 hypothetical protein [Priestia flexa]MCA1201094.1 hypothetical protein [Priestia flexa]MCP1189189.1 hypothetical protein [Priestia flexa]
MNIVQIENGMTLQENTVYLAAPHYFVTLKGSVLETPCETLEDYRDYLNDHPVEIVDLQRDLLIVLTQFLRDKEAFSLIEEQINQYFEPTKYNSYQVKKNIRKMKSSQLLHLLLPIAQQVSLLRTIKVKLNT